MLCHPIFSHFLNLDAAAEELWGAPFCLLSASSLDNVSIWSITTPMGGTNSRHHQWRNVADSLV
jgi:hypothetical protein